MRVFAARRDDRAAVGWAWTGRNLILDEALAVSSRCVTVASWTTSSVTVCHRSGVMCFSDGMPRGEQWVRDCCLMDNLVSHSLSSQ